MQAMPMIGFFELLLLTFRAGAGGGGVMSLMGLPPGERDPRFVQCPTEDVVSGFRGRSPNDKRLTPCSAAVGRPVDSAGFASFVRLDPSLRTTRRFYGSAGPSQRRPSPLTDGHDP